jgi:hypothetical protein
MFGLDVAIFENRWSEKGGVDHSVLIHFLLVNLDKKSRHTPWHFRDRILTTQHSRFEICMHTYIITVLGDLVLLGRSDRNFGKNRRQRQQRWQQRKARENQNHFASS